MRANELQVGDWVDCPDKEGGSRSCIVKEIMERNGDDYFVLFMPSIVKDDFYAYQYAIKPIQLCPEIIEMFPFEEKEIETGSFSSDYFDLWACDRDGRTWAVGSTGIKISYVHQLQQLLRLCGYNKKIKL